MRNSAKLYTIAIVAMLVATSAFVLINSDTRDGIDGLDDADIRTIDLGRGIGIETANMLSDNFYDVSFLKDEDTFVLEGMSNLVFTDQLVGMGFDDNASTIAEFKGTYSYSTGFINADASAISDGNLLTQDSLEGSPVYYDDGTFDIFFTMNGELVSLTELIGVEGDKENCFAFLAPFLAIPGLNVVVAGVILAGMAYVAFEAINNNGNQNNPANTVQPDGTVIRNKSVPVGVWFNKIYYEIEDLTQNRNKKEPGKIYLAALLNDIVYVSKMAISMNVAQNIIKFNDTRVNTYTVNDGDAFRIVDSASNPLLKFVFRPIKHSAHDKGYYEHWHLNNLGLSLESHSFFGQPSGV